VVKCLLRAYRQGRGLVVDELLRSQSKTNPEFGRWLKNEEMVSDEKRVW
jgi:hypothetical protein